MSKSMLTEQRSRYHTTINLQPFLTFLKLERGFADATIVNRERSLNPFLGWLVAQDVPLSTVSPVTITKYFTNAWPAGGNARPSRSCVLSAFVFRYASSRGWCAAGIAESIDAPRSTRTKIFRRPAWEDVKKLSPASTGRRRFRSEVRCAILLCSSTACAVGEVCCLRLEDIDWLQRESPCAVPNRGKPKLIP